MRPMPLVVSSSALAWAALLSGCSTDTFLLLDGGDPGDAQAEASAIDGAIDGGGAGDADSSIMDVGGDGADGAQSYRRVFITSGDYSGNLGGLPGADAICNFVATGAGLSGTWVAWLSSSFASASSRLTHAAVPYQLLDGTVVAPDWAGLTSGTLVHAIDCDEHGTFVPYNGATTPFSGVAWSGTAPDGTLLTGCNSTSGCTCLDWTVGTDASAGSFGLDSMTNSSWTEEGYAYICGQQYSLYCFEQ